MIHTPRSGSVVGTSIDVAAGKARLRKSAKAALVAVTSTERIAAGRRAAAEVGSTATFRDAALVLAFLSMPTEIDTGTVIEAALAAGKRVAVPRIEGDDIAFVELDADWRNWPRDRWDIPEPPASITGISAEDIATTPTVALVPGLAFDRSGGRLGRGKGYYDRFLARLDAARRRSRGIPASFVAIGFGYAFQLVDRVPMEDSDRRLDGLALG